MKYYILLLPPLRQTNQTLYTPQPPLHPPSLSHTLSHKHTYPDTPTTFLILTLITENGVDESRLLLLVCFKHVRGLGGLYICYREQCMTGFVILVISEKGIVCLCQMLIQLISEELVKPPSGSFFSLS